MIVHPEKWKGVGERITLKQVEETILTVLSEVDCNCLSLSGGLDSSLLLYFMTRIFGKDVRCFTMACSEDHPDYVFSNLVSRYFKVDNEVYVPYSKPTSGDDIVKAFYENLSKRGFPG